MYQQQLIEMVNQLKKQYGNFHSLTISYSGYGDSGAIDHVVMEKEKNQRVTINLEDVCKNALYEFFYLYMDEKFPGWELNSGSYGNLTIIPKEDKILIEHDHEYIIEMTETFSLEESIKVPSEV